MVGGEGSGRFTVFEFPLCLAQIVYLCREAFLYLSYNILRSRYIEGIRGLASLPKAFASCLIIDQK